MFDRILAKVCLLHCEVLDWDTQTVVDLLQKASGVNAVDKGGRTALHLIASQGPGYSVGEKITKILLKSRATVNLKDKLLNWTPLHYARQTGNKIVEQLLKG